MATLEQLIQDLLAPVEPAGRHRHASAAQSAHSAHSAQSAQSAAGVALPDWMNPIALRPTRWDWYDVDSGFDGLEVTEHAVPPGWFERTFGVSARVAS